MTIQDKLPNLANSFERLKLILDLAENANPKTLTGIAILNARQGGQYLPEK